VRAQLLIVALSLGACHSRDAPRPDNATSAPVANDVTRNSAADEEPDTPVVDLKCAKDGGFTLRYHGSFETFQVYVIDPRGIGTPSTFPIG